MLSLIVCAALIQDPYGIGPLVNGVRVQSGRSTVSYDSTLSAAAVQNNTAQMQRGLGHWIVPTGCWQNAGWGYNSTQSVFQGWMNSPGHRKNILAPVTRYGIARNGSYWTLNLR